MSDVAATFTQLEVLQQMQALQEQFGDMKQRLTSMKVSMGELEARFQQASPAAHHEAVYCEGQPAANNRLPHGPHVVDQHSVV